VLTSRLTLGVATLVAAVVNTGCQQSSSAGSQIDSGLRAEIAKIKAIDNHAHPVRPVGAGEAPDTDYDALPVENLEAQSDPVRFRSDARELTEARQSLFQGPPFHGDKSAAAKTLGQDYPVKVLDELGIEKMLANRVAMGPGFPAKRFLWVPYADALMYPLANDAMIQNPDQKAFFALEEKLLKRYYGESGVGARPATLDEYLAKVVRGTLERHKQAGAVAEKFEMAYLRPLDVGNPSKAEAESAWSGKGNYKLLQDYILRFIAAECGRLGMAVHFHSDSGGGSYFNVSGVNPLLLEPLLNDPALRNTKFVFVHGGWPYTREITPLLTKPNAYLDFSSQTSLLYPPEAAKIIRAWLEFVPEKVLFATDAYPYSAESGWEETGYIAAASGREALGIALTGMLADGEITKNRALELAHMVLHDNAQALYKLK
jgi:predicted TIM-barrel fold metal-dependent hydrolase